MAFDPTTAFLAEESPKFDPSTAEEFSGSPNKSIAGDIGTALNIGTTVDIPQQVQGANALMKNVSPLSALAESVIPESVKGWRDNIESSARGLLSSRKDRIQQDLTPETQASNKKEFFGKEATFANITRDGPLAIAGKIKDLYDKGELFGEGWSDPRKIAYSAAESLPSTLVTMGPTYKLSATAFARTLEAETAAGIAGGMSADAAKKAAVDAATKAAERVAMVSGGVGEGVTGAGSQFEQTREAVMKMPVDKLLAHPEFQAEFNALPLSMSATERTRRAKESIADKAATDAGLIAFGFDAVFGALGDRFIGSAAAGKGTRAGSIVRGVGQESLTETIQSGGEQFGENFGVRRYADQNQPLMANVGEQAIGGGLSGGLIGGVFGGALYRSNIKPSDILAAPTVDEAIKTAEDSLAGAADTVANLLGRIDMATTNTGFGQAPYVAPVVDLTPGGFAPDAPVNHDAAYTQRAAEEDKAQRTAAFAANEAQSGGDPVDLAIRQAEEANTRQAAVENNPVIEPGLQKEIRKWREQQAARQLIEAQNGAIPAATAAQVAAPRAQATGAELPGSTGIPLSASVGDTGSVSTRSEVAASGVRPAVSAGTAGNQGVTTQIKTLQERLEKTDPFSEESQQLTGELQIAVSNDAKTAIAAGEMPVYRVTDHVSVAIHPSAQNPGMVQVTRYTKDGVIGDSQYNNIDDAIRQEGLTDKPRISSNDAVKTIEQSIKAEAEYQQRKQGSNNGNQTAQAEQAAPQQQKAPAAAVKPKPKNQERGDLIGAIRLASANGKGISQSLANDLTGDVQGGKLIGLFSKEGQTDLDDLVPHLQSAGYLVNDGKDVAALIRQASKDGAPKTAEGIVDEADANAAAAWRNQVNEEARSMGLKGIGGTRTLEVVEADIRRVLAERSAMQASEERAAIQAEAIADNLYVEGVELSEADLMQWLGSHINYTEEEINEADTRASEGKSRRAEALAVADSEAQAQGSRGERDGNGSTQEGTGFALAGQTNAEIDQQEADRVAAIAAQASEAAKEAAEKVKAEKQSLEDAIKARAANPDNFQFGESGKQAAKPMGSLFDQPLISQPETAKPAAEMTPAEHLRAAADKMDADTKPKEAEPAIKTYPKAQAERMAKSFTGQGMPTEVYAHNGAYALRAPNGTQFSARRENAEKSLADVRQKIEQDGIKLDVSENNGTISISRIVVPEADRGNGKGTSAMQSIVDYADRTGQHITLSPSADFGGNKPRLIKFYKQFGFVENKGRNRAFSTSDSMYREAAGRTLYRTRSEQLIDNDLSGLEEQAFPNIVGNESEATEEVASEPLADAPASTDRTAATIQQALAQKVGSVPAITIHSGLNPAGSISRATFKAINAVAKIFKQRVVYFESDRPAADGFIHGGVIYLNVDSSVSPQAVLGHELTHRLQQEVPEAWQAVAQVMAQRMDQVKLIAMYRSYNSKSSLTDAQIIESLQDEKDIESLMAEMVSDYAGNQFTDESFWSDVFGQMAQGKPEGVVRKLVERLRLAVMKMVGLMNREINQPGFREVWFSGEDNTAAWGNDVNAALKSAYAQWVDAINTTGYAAMQEAHAAKFSKDREDTSIDPDDEISADRIIEIHGIKDNEKFDDLARRFKEAGKWTGRPVLVYEDQSGGVFALTGSHRIAAARKAGIYVPVVYVDQDAVDYESNDEYLADVVGSGDDRVADFLREAGDSRAADLMDAESDANNGRFVAYSNQRTNDLQSDHELLNNTTTHRTIDRSELTALRRAASNLERPRDGIYLRITEDGNAIATGPKGVRIPDTFRRFANEHDLAFYAERRIPKPPATGESGAASNRDIGITRNSEPMPIAYRESGARYFGEDVGEAMDRSDKTRFSTQREGEKFAAEFVNELSFEDAAFRHPISKSLTLEGNILAAYPGAEYLGEDTRPDEREESKADHRFVFAYPDGRFFYVFGRGNEVWIDVSRSLPGHRTSAIYHGVSNYAYNTGKVFVGDPNGLTEDSIVRRTSAMLSSALRFGTTAHFDAAREQIKGVPEKGIEPLNWHGDDVAKTTALIHTFVTTLQNQHPDIKHDRYDFATGRFLDSNDRPIEWEDLRVSNAAARSPGARAARAGEGSLRRGILLQSLASSESSKRPELLELVLNRSAQLVRDKNGLKALFSPARDQTETPEFRKWFGASKAVDSEGRPLVVYHGTNADFSEFKTTRGGEFGPAIYLTDSPREAGEYGEVTKGVSFAAPSAHVMPVYARIEHPYTKGVDAFWKEFGGESDAAGVERAKAAGYDGIIAKRADRYYDNDAREFVDRGNTLTHYIAFKPEQIKSASGNSGQFDASNPDIRFSTPRSAITGQNINQAWADQDNLGAWDNFVRTMQDKLIDTKRVVAEIRKAGIAVKDAFDPYLQEILYHGRVATRVHAFSDNELKPLLIEMQARGIEKQSFEDYLWARHAVERNVQIAKVNPKMPDGGSGLTNQQAQDILAGNKVTVDGRDIHLTRLTGHQSLAKRVDAITKETTDLLVSYGLETQETVDAWRATYGNYVPLMRDMESDDSYAGAFNLGQGAGQGFSVRGSAAKRAMGSEKGVIDILANVAMQRERAIVRGETNRVSQALYGLTLIAPNPDFWMTINPDARKDPKAVIAELVAMGVNPIDAANIANEPKQQYVDPRTGMVAERVNPQLRNRDDVLAVRINGKDRYVLFSSNERAQQMVRNLKNLDAEQLGVALQNVAVATRWFSSINTQYNPVFGLTNGVRDLGSAALNLSSTELKNDRAAVLTGAFSALRGIYADLRDHRAGRPVTSKWAMEFEEFAREGGQTGYRDMFQTSQARSEDLAKELKNAGKGQRWAAWGERNSHIFGWLSDYNTSIEIAVRLSAYVVAKGKGMSKQQAAALAKNLTVNFNKKGLAATQAGALFAFFNAAVQGTARIGETMVRIENGKPSLTKAGKTIMYGGMMVGVMQAVLFMLAGYDDENPPQFQREKNFIVPLPDGKFISIPYPLGFHVIPGVGRIAAEFALGGFKKPGKRLTDLTSMIFDGYSPIGGTSGGLTQLLAPTIMDPIVALSENKDWTGKGIYKEDFNKMHPTAGWTRKKDSSSDFSRSLAYGINYITGGGKYEIGMLSPTPDQIDYLIGQAAGGVGREALKAYQFTKNEITGEDIPLYKVPVVGRFVGETTGKASETSRFYDNLKRIGEHKSALDEMIHAKDGDARLRYLIANPDARMIPAADHAQREISLMNKRKRELMEKDASRDAIKLIEMQITERIKKYNEKLSERQPGM